MNKLLGSIALLLLAFPALGCDEACQRERAQAEHNVDFPGYLSWQFCEDTKLAFLRSDVTSLEKYRNNHLDTSQKGRMRNINHFVQQRYEWLAECDNYMKMTNYGRIFMDKETTEKLFAAMNSVSRELERAISGVTYVVAEGQDKNAIISAKFDHLFKLVDDHKAVTMLQGQFRKQ